jgi:CRP-like cAMP-binding protein
VGTESTDQEFIAVLKGCPLFSLLAEEQLKEVAETARRSDFDRDQMIIEEGDAAATFYVILKGLVEVRHADQPVARLGPGQFFGEVTLVKGTTPSMSVLALRPTSCVKLTGSQLRSYPAVVVKVLEETARRDLSSRSKSELPTVTNGQPASAAEMAIEFKSDKAKSLFDSLVRFFTEDYMVRRLYLEQAGWRTIGELSVATKIPHTTLYGEHGNYGPPMNELLARGLIETRVFSGQRGRGGEVLKARIAYDKEPVKRYVDRVVLKRKPERT